MTTKAGKNLFTASLMSLLAVLLVLSATALAGEKTIFSFPSNGSGGASVPGNLVFDPSATHLYGTTANGGVFDLTHCGGGCALVFELTRTASGPWQETVIHGFTGGVDGAVPSAGLVADAKGNLYGTTRYGGQGAHCSNVQISCGTVFRLIHTPSGWSETILHAFGGASDGSYPQGPVILDAQGNLYGTTQSDGDPVCKCGTVYEIQHLANGHWSKKRLYAFTSGSDGAAPFAGLAFDGAGNLYGTTVDGGSFNSGTVFKLSPAGGGAWTESVIYTFGSASGDGSWPSGDLTIDSLGNLYGTTSGGGAGFGTVFELSPSGGSWTENVIHTFQGGADGSTPYSSLTFDSAGNLYGTTWTGGTNNAGTVYELSPAGGGDWTETLPIVFNGKNGMELSGGVIFDKQGNFYGGTEAGGSNGLVYEFVPR